MEFTGQDDPPSSEMSPAAWQLSQPWWLHPRCSAAAPAPSSRDTRRQFTAMATQIGLAAWMLGTALTSACVPADLIGGAPAAAHLDWLLRPPTADELPAPAARIPAAAITATRVDVGSAPAPITH